jgi:general secretion pathway protein A
MHTIVVIDEAQSITEENLFEEMRLLLNFQNETAVYSTLVLLGQPPLGENIARIPQLAQRLAIRYHLTPFNEPETKEYIEHRLKVSGCDRVVFSEETFKDIYTLSQGVPRAINNICDLALFSAYSRKVSCIDQKAILDAGQDLGQCKIG